MDERYANDHFFLRTTPGYLPDRREVKRTWGVTIRAISTVSRVIREG